MQPNGFFVIDTVNLPVIVQDNTYLGQYFKVDHCYYFTSEYARKLLEYCGFEIMASDIASWPGHEMFICRKKNPFMPEKTRINIEEQRKSFIRNIEHWYYLEDTTMDRILAILARIKRKIIR